MIKTAGISILTNRVNGKKYVGQDTQLGSRPKRHLRGKVPGCRLIYRAIQKQGAAAFDVELIPYPGISQTALNAVERWHIEQHFAQAPNGYNLQAGGHNGTHAEETKQKLRQLMLDRWKSGIDTSARNFFDTQWQQENNPRYNGSWQQKQGKKGGLANRERLIALNKSGNNPRRDPQWQRKTHAKQIEKHGLCGYLKMQKEKSLKGAKVTREKWEAVRLERIRTFAILLTSRSVLQEYRHRQLTRDGFFDKEIPDTSQSQQLSLI